MPAPDIRAAAVRRGRAVLELEAGALAAVAGRLDDRFGAAVELLAGAAGRVVVSGVGKSGAIGRKIAATLTSTGTPATFLHPVDSVHGDLGIVGPGDVAILISKSGETAELLGLVEHLTRLGTPIVAITGRGESSLARQAAVALDAAVEAEACPFDLAPTTSTTVQLAIGDALAVALLEAKGFRAEDFARIHPGGSLGRRLLLRVDDVMTVNDLPVLAPDALMRDAVVVLAEKRGTAVITDGSGRILGVLTAGDLTRLMEKRDDFLAVRVAEIMTRNPRIAESGELAAAVVYRMEQHGIMAMPVIDSTGRLAGMAHLHDLMRAGAA